MSVSVFLMLVVACCGYAFWRGGAPERVAAGLQLGAYAATLIVHRLFEGSAFAQVALGTAGIDLVLLAALVGLAWRSTRFWPLWIAGWHAAALIGHLAKAIDPGMGASGYAIQSQIWAYPMLLATAAGAWRHARRTRRDGSDPAWKMLVA